MLGWANKYVWRNASLFLWLAGIGVFVIGTLSLAYGLRHAALAGILLFLSVVAHESAHAGTCYAFGCEVKAVRCSVIGPHIVRSRSTSANVELAVAAAGPLMNLLLCGCLLVSSSSILVWAGLANFMLATVNLMPFKNSDGRRVAEALRQMLRASGLSREFAIAQSMDSASL